ncbi:chymotrypsin-C-like [Agrilus planipennis]|uniref:limulus clotting factor C n=1 Tax=Agrilus planipennis TaxID=224129 RepID=A0A1W4W5B6_AGRPL|nr:chymotrypsin-C-like [Agrilus planipennis]
MLLDDRKIRHHHATVMGSQLQIAPLLLHLLLLLLLLIVPSFSGSMSSVQECGRSVRRSRQPRYGSLGRIIHGKQSVRGAWPWQVSLQLLHPQFGFLGHWCGGVLISPKWLLTAAHCINNDLFNLPLAALWTAVLGEWDQQVEEYSEERIPIEKIILHERFHHFQHDIALMKLSRSVQTSGSSRIRIVCLPSSRLTYNQTTHCIATGWGRDAEDGHLSGRLLESHIPVHDNAVCREKYGHSVSIKSGHLCAGHLDGSTGTCVGDSGGPLQCASKDGQWILAGITSFGSGCAKPGFPDVYTRLSYYLPWIRAKMHSSNKIT